LVDAPVVDKPVVDAPVVDAPVVDAPQDIKPDAQIDAPPSNLWVFVTVASFNGAFGAASGARATADSKCQDMYNANFTARSCTNTHVHAVIQIDDDIDTLDRMRTTFQIPKMTEVLRATDATRVTEDWDTLVNPTGVLLAPVSATAPAPFWSGRGFSPNLHCSSWTSNDAGMVGIAGDATLTSGWWAKSGTKCDRLDPHLLCICW
jgi:hypothetical protein